MSMCACGYLSSPISFISLLLISLLMRLNVGMYSGISLSLFDGTPTDKWTYKFRIFVYDEAAAAKNEEARKEKGEEDEAKEKKDLSETNENSLESSAPVPAPAPVPVLGAGVGAPPPPPPPPPSHESSLSSPIVFICDMFLNSREAVAAVKEKVY